MTRALSILFCLLAGFCRAGDLPFANGDRLAILGHSLTIAPTGLWADPVRAYIALQNPDKNLQMLIIAHSGMSIAGEFTNSDLTLQEYDKYVYPFLASSTGSTNYVFVLFGGAGPTTGYQSNVNVLIDDYIVGENSAVPIIVGMTPEPDLSGFSGGPAFSDAEIAAAQSYTPDKLYTTNWYALYQRFTNAANYDALKFDPIGDPSNVHPSKAGNIAEAWETIRELGWETNVSSATVDAATAAIVATNHCVISSVAGGASNISFVRHDLRLPWAIDEAGRHDATNIWPEMIGWQNYSVQVTGLAFGNYDWTINGTYIGRVSSAQLAAGYNMADLTVGPAHDIAQNTLNALRDLQDLDRITLTGLNTTKGWSMLRAACRTAYEDNGKRGATLVADAGVQTALASVTTLSDAVHTAAQPINLTNVFAPVVDRYAGGRR